jgi:hypothetical protein
MSHKAAAAYPFRAPTQELNYHAQLQEWADKNHVLLDWQLLQSEYTNGMLIHAVYPISEYMGDRAELQTEIEPS